MKGGKMLLNLFIIVVSLAIASVIGLIITLKDYRQLYNEYTEHLNDSIETIRGYIEEMEFNRDLLAALLDYNEILRKIVKQAERLKIKTERKRMLKTIEKMLKESEAINKTMEYMYKQVNNQDGTSL